MQFVMLINTLKKRNCRESILDKRNYPIIRNFHSCGVYWRKIRNFREYCSQIYLYSDICFSLREIFKANNILRYVKKKLSTNVVVYDEIDANFQMFMVILYEDVFTYTLY